MNEKENVFSTLMSWCEELETRGLPRPASEDLQRVVDRLPLWPEAELSPTTNAWRQTIEYLYEQICAGVPDPVSKLPSELTMPTEPPMNETRRTGYREQDNPQQTPVGDRSRPATDRNGRSVGETPEIRALLQWRDSVAGLFNPRDLKLFNRRVDRLATSTEASQIRNVLPSTFQRYAEDILALVMSARAGNPIPPGRSNGAKVVATTTSTEQARPLVNDGARSTPDLTPADGAYRVMPSPDDSPAGTGEDEIDPDGFAADDFSRTGQEPVSIRLSVHPDKGVQLSWPTPDDNAPVRVYRIVVGDEVPPWSPESGRLVRLTAHQDAEDVQPFAGPLRYYQVWYNSGTTVAEAKAAQPVLYAQQTLICPVRNVVIREDNGSVIGEWDVFTGVTRVHLYRVPIEKAAYGGLSPTNLILDDEEKLTGFQDTTVRRGAHYLYQAIAEVVVGDISYLSPPVSIEQHVSVVLEPVADLEAQLTGDDASPSVDLSWTPPDTGHVIVYRTNIPPRAGIEDEEHDAGALLTSNLSDDDRLAHPHKALGGGKEGITGAPWPRGWNRAYFTPVTTLNGRVYVGKHVALTRLGSIRDPVLRERVDEQVLTFSWPDGAASVWVYQEILGDGEPDTNVSRDTYERLGGLRFPGRLPEDGCTLHLVPVAFGGGETFRGTPVTVEYRGIRRIHYTTSVKRNILRGTPTSLHVSIYSETPLPPASEQNPPISFAMVCNADRLPLHSKDGFALGFLPAGAEGGVISTVITPPLSTQASPTSWFAPVEKLYKFKERKPYYVRLFALLDAAHLSQIAVLDPPIESLKLRRE